jgi:HK97 family phage major capsid protein
MRLKQLLARQAGILHKVQEIEKAAGDKPLTDEQRAELKALRAESTQLAEDIAEARATIELERSLMARQPTDANQLEVERQAREETGHIEMGADRAALDPTAGFRSFADFARAVRGACSPMGGRDERLTRGIYAAPTNYQSETGTAGEGYAVPAQYRDELFQLAFPGDDLVSALNPEPTDSNAVDFDADETTPWGATGVQAKWRSEATQMAASKGDTKLRTLRLQELYAFVTASEELLADAPRLQNRLLQKSADAIRYKASEALVNGTGAGQPLGWMKSAALVTISKESGQTAGTIVAANVLKMYSRLLADGGSPFWLVNRDALPQIALMTIGNQPIWTPPVSGMKEAPNGMLLGLPIRYSEHAETCGTKGDIQLINPIGYYAAVKRGDGMQVASSIHLYFDYGLQAFRSMFRLGGQPFLSAAVSPAKGSSTKSHFVVIETRS